MFLNRFKKKFNTGEQSVEKDATEYFFKKFNKIRKVKNPKTFCYAPFKSMYFDYNGNIIACCSNHTHIFGKYPEQTIKEVWFGKSIVELRKCLCNYNLLSGCNACYEQVVSGAFNAVKSLNYDCFSGKNKYPALLEFALSNTCNMECIMCSGELSSRIRKNKEKLNPVISSYDEDFIVQLEEFIPYLIETKFYGGEPFLISLYYKIWERIIDLNPGCKIIIQTNGSILNEKVKKILSKGNFSITISVDSVEKKTFEKIRKFSHFETVIRNADYFQNYCKKKNSFFGFSFCPIRYNWKEIPQFIDYANNKNIPVNFHTVWLPPEIALWTLSYKQLNDICNFLNLYNFPTNSAIKKNNTENFLALKEQVSGWRDYNKKAETEYLHIDKLTTPELEKLFIEKILLHYRSVKHLKPIVYDENYYNSLCHKIFITTNKNELNYLLKKLLFIPANIIEAIFEHPSEEFILTQIKLFTKL